MHSQAPGLESTWLYGVWISSGGVEIVFSAAASSTSLFPLHGLATFLLDLTSSSTSLRLRLLFLSSWLCLYCLFLLSTPYHLIDDNTMTHVPRQSVTNKGGIHNAIHPPTFVSSFFSFSRVLPFHTQNTVLGTIYSLLSLPTSSETNSHDWFPRKTHYPHTETHQRKNTFNTTTKRCLPPPSRAAR